MTDPFFGPSPTPTKYTFRYNRGGSPYYGDKTTGLFGLAGGMPPRTSLFKILKESDHLQLYGHGKGTMKTMYGHGMGRHHGGVGHSHLGEAHIATTAVTTGIFTGVVITGLAISYGLGRFIGAPIIEMASGQKLTTAQKRGVGVATMIL
tara:strand:+ start:3763 stop:4209 length:447 start_codon:yes stop_codon:yes gene_type:complete